MVDPAMSLLLLRLILPCGYLVVVVSELRPMMKRCSSGWRKAEYLYRTVDWRSDSPCYWTRRRRRRIPPSKGAMCGISSTTWWEFFVVVVPLLEVVRIVCIVEDRLTDSIRVLRETVIGRKPARASWQAYICLTTRQTSTTKLDVRYDMHMCDWVYVCYIHMLASCMVISRDKQTHTYIYTYIQKSCPPNGMQ